MKSPLISLWSSNYRWHQLFGAHSVLGGCIGHQVPCHSPINKSLVKCLLESYLVRLEWTRLQNSELLLLHSEQGVPVIDASHRVLLLWHRSQAASLFFRVTGGERKSAELLSGALFMGNCGPMCFLRTKESMSRDTRQWRLSTCGENQDKI